MRKKILNKTLWSLFILAIGVFCAFKFGYLPLSIAYGPERAASSLCVKGQWLVDVKVGGGVLLGDVSEGVTNIYFLTARHTVTLNRDYLSNFRIYYRSGAICRRMILSNTVERWMTLKDASKPDCAWIKLNKNELPKDLSALSFIAISNVVDTASYTPNEGNKISMVDSISKYTGHFVQYDTIAVPNNENRFLHQEIYSVGIIDKFTPITFSGSPVFARRVGDPSLRLIGITAISNDSANRTGYLPISRIIHSISNSPSEAGVARLIDYPELW